MTIHAKKLAFSVICASTFCICNVTANATEVITAYDINAGSENVRIYRPTISTQGVDAQEPAPRVAETKVVVNMPIYVSSRFRRNWGWRTYRRALRATGPNYPGFGGHYLGPRYPF